MKTNVPRIMKKLNEMSEKELIETLRGNIEARDEANLRIDIIKTILKLRKKKGYE